jgi:hypothetical protein
MVDEPGEACCDVRVVGGEAGGGEGVQRGQQVGPPEGVGEDLSVGGEWLLRCQSAPAGVEGGANIKSEATVSLDELARTEQKAHHHAHHDTHPTGLAAAGRWPK